MEKCTLVGRPNILLVRHMEQTDPVKCQHGRNLLQEEFDFVLFRDEPEDPWRRRVDSRDGTGKGYLKWEGGVAFDKSALYRLSCVLGAQLSWGASRGVGLFHLAKFRAIGLLQKTSYLHAVTLESGATICIFRDP